MPVIGQFNFLWVVAALFLLEILYFGFVWLKFYRAGTKEKVCSRMEAYALLKRGSDICDVAENRCLSSGAHEVLLGTLKKVEQKSSVLTAIIVFSFGIFTSAVYDDAESYDMYGWLALTLGVGLCLPLFFSFIGIRQIDQTNFQYESGCERPQIATALQEALIVDLVSKERAFHFSRHVTTTLIILFIGALVADALLGFYGVDLL
jgi:hypothetical protein